MKFVRNAKIFRGQLDVAPAVGVFFLLALMVLLHSAITFTPGLLVQLGSVGTGTNAVPVLQLDMHGLAHYRGDELRLEKLEGIWLEEARMGKAPPLVWLATEPGTPTNLVLQAEIIAAAAGVTIRPLGTRVELPEIDDLPGTTNASLVVAINLNGQVFFENQMVEAEVLRKKLVKAQASSREPLTLILQADRGVEYGNVLSLSVMARQAGFAEVLLATRPSSSLNQAPASPLPVP